MANLRINNPNFDHSSIIIKPPHISNTPLYDYMAERDVIFPRSRLRTDNFNCRKYKRTDKFMTGLYLSSLGLVSGTCLVCYNKIKHLLKYL